MRARKRFAALTAAILTALSGAALAQEYDAQQAKSWKMCIRDRIKTVCWCGRKATFNARVQNGHIVREGEQIMMGGNSAYVSLCRRHWKDGNLGSFCNLNLED